VEENRGGATRPCDEQIPDGHLGVDGTTGLRERASTTARVETHTRGEGDEGRRRITECGGRRRHDSNSFPRVPSPVVARERDEEGDGVWGTPDTARVGRLELGGLFGLMRIGLSGLFVPDCLACFGSRAARQPASWLVNLTSLFRPVNKEQ
jgi:hypothetical protein